MSRASSLAPPAATTADLLLGALRCFADSRGDVALDLRSFDGIGYEKQLLESPLGVVPMYLIDALRSGWTARVAPVTRTAGGHFVDLPTAVVCWRPETELVDYAHRVTDVARATIVTALATMPAPSLVVDGGPEVWAGWRLDHPVSDLARAQAVLEALAQPLGGDVLMLSDLHDFTVPLAGPIRNWNTSTREPIVIEACDPTRRYTLDALVHRPPTAAPRRIRS